MGRTPTGRGQGHEVKVRPKRKAASFYQDDSADYGEDGHKAKREENEEEEPVIATATFTICGIPGSSRDVELTVFPSPEIDDERLRICARFGIDFANHMICFHVEGESCVIRRPLSDLYYVWDFDDVNENHFCLHLNRFLAAATAAEGRGGNGDGEGMQGGAVEGGVGEVRFDDEDDGGHEDEEEVVEEEEEEEEEESEWEERAKAEKALKKREEKARLKALARAEDEEVKAEKARKRSAAAAEAAAKKERDEHGRFKRGAGSGVVSGGGTSGSGSGGGGGEAREAALSPDTLFVGQNDGAMEAGAMGGHADDNQEEEGVEGHSRNA